MLRFRLLGPVAVERHGEPIDLGPRKQKTVLAVLAANAGSAVSVDRCLQAVWGEDASDATVRSLHTYISNLRGLVDPDRTGIIEGLDGHYRLNVPDGGSLDWVEFEAADADDPDAVESALGLWRGRPLSDVEDDWARPLITSWEERRIVYLISWADARLERGEHASVIADLEPLVDEYPLQEPLVGKLMLALYRSGRQADALRVHEQLRETLLDQLGIDPSPEIQEMQLRILEQDPSLLPRPATPTNVPVPLTETIGRREESQALSGFLDTTRLLTVSGAGGVGKTTAARDLARSRLEDFPDGVWWFELAPIADPSLILGEMVGAMRMPPPRGEHALDYVCRRLGDSTTLLVFDNCEHLVESVARIVNSILESCANVKVLATSREPLALSGELAWGLPPLSSPDERVATPDELLATDAGALFAARAVQALPGFQVTDENAGRIGSICRRLDGLPFAIELAAARLRSMGLGELEGRLDDRFRLLTGGSRSEVPHHQTLRGTVEWSYALLTPREQTLYTDLSVFRGGFGSDAAEAVSGLEDTYELLDSLVGHSLVVAEPEGDSVRYHMLETIREHGQELLSEAGRLDDIRRAHLAWVGDLVRQGARLLETEEDFVWSRRFRRETPNVRAALAYASEHDPVTGAAICGGLSRYWFVYATEVDVTQMEESTSFLEEGCNWSELMLEADLPPKIRARLLTGMGGLLLIRMGRFEEAVRAVTEAQTLWKELGDKRNEGWAIFYEGTASWSLVPIERTIELFDKSTELHREVEDPFGSVASPYMRGVARAVSGDLEAARRDLVEYVEVAGSVPTPWISGHANDTRSLLAVLDGETGAEAMEGARLAIEEFRAVPNYACICHAIQTAGMYLAATGQLEDAARSLGVVQSVRDRLGMVMPPYEDRSFWIEDMGLADLDNERRRELEEEARAMGPGAGIDWVVESISG